MSARWVPQQLTSTHKEQRMGVSLEHLVCYHEDGNDFLFRIVTGDETWVHHFTPESKAASMEWKHPSSPVRKKFKITPSGITCPKEVQDNSLCRCVNFNSFVSPDDILQQPLHKFCKNKESEAGLRALLYFKIKVELYQEECLQ
ncbi:hypothetical protein X975_15031, partial [Stegodyphus mimosarum]